MTRAACCLTLPQGQVCPAASVVKGREHAGRRTGPRHVLKPRRAIEQAADSPEAFLQLPAALPSTHTSDTGPSGPAAQGSKTQARTMCRAWGDTWHNTGEGRTHGQGTHRHRVPDEAGGTWGTGTLVLPFIGECENDLGVMG